MLQSKAMKTYQFTAVIEKDPESGLFYGYIPALPGAHTQGETLDELHANLKEVAILCLEELEEDEILEAREEYIGTQQLTIAV